MAEELKISATSKAGRYEEVLPQIEAVLEYENNLTANLANVTAVLREVFGWFWVGFYLVDSSDELVLAPFQGTLACTRIRRGRGVCGTAWAEGRTVVVEDVEAFPGHIACSSLSRSEIVVPLWVRGMVFGVLDVDSEELATFDEVDREGLERVCEVVSKMIERCVE